MKIEKTILLIAPLLLALFTGIYPVRAQTPTIEVVDPVDGDNTVDLSIQPGGGVGTTFFVDIMISDVSGLFAWQADVAYDPSLLSAVSVNLGEPWLTLVLLGRASCPQNIDNTMGAVSAACTLLAPQGPLNFPGVRSNTLYSIEFMVNGNGISALDLMNDVLLTQSLSEIPHSTIDGLFFNKPIEKKGGLAGRGSWAEKKHFSLSRDRDGDGKLSLFAKLGHTGTVGTITAHATFTVSSPVLGELPAQSTGETGPLAPGQTETLDTLFDPQGNMGTYTVQVTVTVTGGDCDVCSDTFSFKVVA